MYCINRRPKPSFTRTDLIGPMCTSLQSFLDCKNQFCSNLRLKVTSLCPDNTLSSRYYNTLCPNIIIHFVRMIPPRCGSSMGTEGVGSARERPSQPCWANLGQRVKVVSDLRTKRTLEYGLESAGPWPAEQYGMERWSYPCFIQMCRTTSEKPPPGRFLNLFISTAVSINERRFAYYSWQGWRGRGV